MNQPMLISYNLVISFWSGLILSYTIIRKKMSQSLSFKNVFDFSMNKAAINPANYYNLASDQSRWRNATKQGVKTSEKKNKKRF